MNNRKSELYEIESRVLRLKQIIDLFIDYVDGLGDTDEIFCYAGDWQTRKIPGRRTDYSPVLKFENQDKYPLDFQLYMKHIGNICLVGRDCHMGTVEQPIKIIEAYNDPSNPGDGGKLLWTLGEDLVFDDEHLKETSEFGGNYFFRDPPLQIGDVRICAIDMYFDLGFFDCKETPYMFRTVENPMGCSFFEWWINVFCVHIDGTLRACGNGPQTEASIS